MTETVRAELDQLSTEELRSRAFSVAEKRHDVRFFWDLAKHLPASGDAATDDGFSGPGTTIADYLELFREMRGDIAPEREPLLRAAFIDYLAEHPQQD